MDRVMNQELPPLPFLRRWRLGAISVLLLAGGYLGLSLSSNNRLFLYFDWRDTVAALVLLAGSGGLAALALHFGAKVSGGRSDRWLAPWFYFFAVLVAFNFFPALRQKWAKHAPWLSGTVYYLMIWGLGGALTAAGYAWPRMRKVAAQGWRGLGVLWPLLLILPFSLATAKKWPGTSGTTVRLERRADGNAAPVVVLILDMIGYDDAFTPAGEVRAGLPGLAAFATSATVFHQARSCGDFTLSSLPGLMLQEEVGNPLLGKKDVRWKVQPESGAPARLAREFEMALPARFKAAGGRAVYIGYYLPYAEIMPGAWDEVYSPCFYGVVPAGGSSAWKAKFWHQAVQYLMASKDPLAGLAKQFSLYVPMQNRYHRKITGDILAAGQDYIREALSPGDLVILHLTVPHPPFVFDADGGPSRFGREDPAGYADQLRYADRLFGELTDELKQSGQWARSWVIMMSDHGSHFVDWSLDPAKKRHVPFMVKAPGQTMRQDRREPIRLADFERIPGFPLAADTGE